MISTSRTALSPAPAPVGAGLKPRHYRDILDSETAVGWFEVHPENYMCAGGPPHRWLERIRQDHPISLHSVGCSLGSTEPIPPEQLAWMKRLTDRYAPFLVSDHLSWSATDGVFLNDLLPLPCTEESLDTVAANVGRLQDALRRPILVENPSTYLRFVHDSMTEPEFLTALVERTGCGLLLDINNVYVCAENHAFDAWDYLTALPHDAVGEIHLAGHAVEHRDGQTIRIDDHGSPVCNAVWSLFARYVGTYGATATLVEWDTGVPPFARLEAEVRHAAEIIDIFGEGYRGAA